MTTLKLTVVKTKLRPGDIVGGLTGKAGFLAIRSARLLLLVIGLIVDGELRIG
jgi:hypothetical protein